VAPPPSTHPELRSSPGPRALASLAGPALIVAAVLVVLSDVAFRGLVATTNPDVLALWLPTHCHLGASLRAADIPLWNPHVMGGLPFAADPQSGWMNLQAMVLYTALPCEAAVRTYLVLQPILAGLGLYAFLRTESVGRPAATLGGLVLAVPIAVSSVALAPPFSAALAWTAVLLALTARALRAETWPARLGWVAGAAVAWGQLAAVHLSEGFVVGTGALAFYLTARLMGDVRSGRRSARGALALVGVLVVAAAGFNLAYLLPRLAYLPRTTLWFGYADLQRRTTELASIPVGAPLPGPAVESTWPLRLAIPPGLFLGGSALAVSLAWWRSRRAHVAAAFAAYAILCYLLASRGVSHTVAGVVRDWPLGDFYLKTPRNFALGAILSLAVMVGLGLDGWLRSSSRIERGLPVAAAVVIWVGLPFLFDGPAPGRGFAAVGAGAAIAVLAAATRRPALAAALPVVLAVELVAGSRAAVSPERDPVGPALAVAAPSVSISAFSRPGPIARGLQSAVPAGRYLSLDPDRWTPRGYHVHQLPDAWPLLGAQRAPELGLEEAQGYNSTQTVRFWEFVRAADPKRIKYNAGSFVAPPPVALDLLGVSAVIHRADASAPVPAREVAAEGNYVLSVLAENPAAASFVGRWVVVGSAAASLDRTLEPGFDPDRLVVLESDPGLTPSSAPGSGSVRGGRIGPQEARFDVVASAPGLLLVRTVFDRGWTARVDGREADVMPADHVVQAIPLPAGRHTVELVFHDPWVGYGLVGSGLSLGAFGAAWLALRRRHRRRPRPSPGEAVR
jgi:hypothetical protein